jgi:hypothetical protein
VKDNKKRKALVGCSPCDSSSTYHSPGTWSPPAAFTAHARLAGGRVAVLPADRRRRVAWGANAPSLSTVIAAAAMMNGAAASSPELANRVSTKLIFIRHLAPKEKKKSNFWMLERSCHFVTPQDLGRASSSDAARRHDVARG